MNKNLLIVGAGIYGVVAKEIAERKPPDILYSSKYDKQIGVNKKMTRLVDVLQS